MIYYITVFFNCLNKLKTDNDNGVSVSPFSAQSLNRMADSFIIHSCLLHTLIEIHAALAISCHNEQETA